MNAKEEARCEKLIDKIDACIFRVLKAAPERYKYIKFTDNGWKIK